MSGHNCMPQKGHLQAIYSILSILKYELKNGITGRIVLDGVISDCVKSSFVKADQREICRDLEEPIPSKAPNPRGKVVKMCCCVDADYTGNFGQAIMIIIGSA